MQSPFGLHDPIGLTASLSRHFEIEVVLVGEIFDSVLEFDHRLGLLPNELHVFDEASLVGL